MINPFSNDNNTLSAVPPCVANADKSRLRKIWVLYRCAIIPPVTQLALAAMQEGAGGRTELGGHGEGAGGGFRDGSRRRRTTSYVLTQSLVSSTELRVEAWLTGTAQAKSWEMAKGAEVPTNSMIEPRITTSWTTNVGQDGSGRVRVKDWLVICGVAAVVVLIVGRRRREEEKEGASAGSPSPHHDDSVYSTVARLVDSQCHYLWHPRTNLLVTTLGREIQLVLMDDSDGVCWDDRVTSSCR
jgi:hypothetical protein